MTTPDKQRLAQLLVDTGAVRFGRFTTKSGRSSPYFVNLGAIHHGEQIAARVVGAKGVLQRGRLPRGRGQRLGQRGID